MSSEQQIKTFSLNIFLLLKVPKMQEAKNINLKPIYPYLSCLLIVEKYPRVASIRYYPLGLPSQEYQELARTYISSPLYLLILRYPNLAPNIGS